MIENRKTSTASYCGFIAIVGRPNVGKSSLLNAIIRRKISITSFKPQTTRHQILGIKTRNHHQTVYVDTPGLHKGGAKALNRQMNKVAHAALEGVDAVIFVVEALKWTHEDNLVCELLQSEKSPVVVAINKIDLIADKTQMLAFIQTIAEKLPNATIIPISARKRSQIDVLEKKIEGYLPKSVFFFPEDQTLQQSDQFYISEIIREKLLFSLEKELPYSITVEVEKLEHKERIVHIAALIWVEREGQKVIVVGERGGRLKSVGIHARQDLEKFFGKKVNLKLWVKVKENWADDLKALASLGYA